MIVLLVIFHIGRERYALDSRYVAEIVPLVPFRELPRAPEYVCGLFEYRGRIVPVVDLSSMAGKGSAKRLLSTRIILIQYKDGRDDSRVLGLLAEQVTETIKVDETLLSSPGIRVGEAPYLGKVMTDPKGMIQCIQTEELLPASVRDVLFPIEEG